MSLTDLHVTFYAAVLEYITGDVNDTHRKNARFLDS